MDPQLVDRFVAQGFNVRTIEHDFEILSSSVLRLYKLIIISKSDGLSAIFPFISKVRASELTYRIPIILITENNDEEQIIECLDRGFDDVILSGINTEILLRKAKNLVERSKKGSDYETFDGIGLVLDPNTSSVFINDCTLQLTFTEFKLLKEILISGVEIVNRRELQQKVFGYQNAKNRAMDVHIHNIRRKLEPFGFTIEAVRSIGCRIKEVKDGQSVQSS